MALTDTKLRNLKPVARATKLYDTLGLFLLCNPPSERNPKGSRLWRCRYHYAGKEKLLAFGCYPDISLQQAREQRDKARKQLAQGEDPSEQRRQAHEALRDAHANSFEAIAREWLERQKSKLDEVTLKKADALLAKWAFPWIGSRPISAITPRELLDRVLRRVESTGSHMKQGLAAMQALFLLGKIFNNDTYNDTLALVVLAGSK